ncbi:hypothetical protein [Lentzea cavernae]|uniref:hypothetical protein n=1 Tax=Lentzea cavernae TaxID=2020703 RepID=UPI001748BBFF|nr:hypothetical protein [Lentzea cavernae]
MSHLLVRESHMSQPVPEYVSTFLIPVRRRDGTVNIGAAVNDRGQVVILPLPSNEPLALSMHEATEFQKKIRQAVVDASQRQF